MTRTLRVTDRFSNWIPSSCAASHSRLLCSNDIVDSSLEASPLIMRSSVGNPTAEAKGGSVEAVELFRGSGMSWHGIACDECVKLQLQITDESPCAHHRHVAQSFVSRGGVAAMVLRY